MIPTPPENPTQDPTTNTTVFCFILYYFTIAAQPLKTQRKTPHATTLCFIYFIYFYISHIQERTLRYH